MTIDCTGLTGSTASITSTYIRSSKLTASASVTIRKIRATLSSVSGNVKFAIYSDDSDSPGDLLATTGSHLALDGQNDYTLVSPYVVTSGNDYWISIQASSEVTTVSGSSGPRDNLYAAGVAYATDPDPYPTPSTAGGGFQFCISTDSVSTGGTRLPPPPIEVAI